MDKDTVGLIPSLQLDGLRPLVSSRKGKAPDADEELAVVLQRNELQTQQARPTDIRMTRSLSWVVQDDGATIKILAAEVHRSTQDRDMACRLSGQPTYIARRKTPAAPGRR
jgi:hypothetical protein